MPELCLFVADISLRRAVVEQLKLAVLGTVRENAGISIEALAASAEIVIFETGLLDKKTTKIIRDFYNREASEKKSVIFLLGENTANGIEDIITESFSLPLRLGHLLARVQFYLQVGPRLRGEPFVFGPYRLEPQAKQVVVEQTGAVIRLTEKEASLLTYLGQSEQPISREELLAAIRGYDGRIDTHTLETHIYRLRRKLDPEEKGLNTIVSEQGAYSLNRTSSVA